MKNKTKKTSNVKKSLQSGLSSAVGAGIGVAAASLVQEAMAEDALNGANAADIFGGTETEPEESEQVVVEGVALEDQDIINNVVINNTVAENHHQPSQVQYSDDDYDQDDDSLIVVESVEQNNYQEPIAAAAEPQIQDAQVNITSITVDGHEVVLMDNDGDGIVDIMAVDTNNDMLLSEDEMVDVSQDGFAIADADSVEQYLSSAGGEQESYAMHNDSQNDYTAELDTNSNEDYYQFEEDDLVASASDDDYYMSEGSYTIDNSLADYNNQANVNDFMS